MTTRGLFIVFEGLDGSGTSTQARMLQEGLAREGRRGFLTAEPTTGPIGGMIRLAMSHRLRFSSDPRVEDRQLAHLFAADRYDHLYNEVDGVLAQLASGATVISTRYALSSFAYLCHDDADRDLVQRLNQDFPPADLTFFVDTPVEVCVERIQARQFVGEKYENTEKLRTVRENFRRALADYPHTLHVVDGRTEPGALHEQILGIVRDALEALGQGG
jgi:dTMP kinase